MRRYKLAAISNVVSLLIPQLLKTTSTSDKIYLAYAGKRPNQTRWGSVIFNRPLHVKNKIYINLLTPNVNYSGRTAPLTSEVAFYIFIQQI